MFLQKPQVLSEGIKSLTQLYTKILLISYVRKKLHKVTIILAYTLYIFFKSEPSAFIMDYYVS